MSCVGSLPDLLVRIQTKIDSRTRRPWFDLQRSHYYSSSSTINSPNDLRLAFKHFHVMLSDPELQQLYAAFADNSGIFDFKAFATRMYPQEAAVKGTIREGRVLSSQVEISENQQQYNNDATSETAEQQQHAATAQSQLYNTEPQLIDTVAAPTQLLQYKPTTTTKGNSHKTLVKPRITHNRPFHLQTYRQSAHEKLIFPTEQPYPSQEFKPHGQYASTEEKPRFEMKALPKARYELRQKRK